MKKTTMKAFKKKKLFISTILLCLITAFCYADPNDINQTEDNVYQLSKGTKIKIDMPDGWEIFERDTFDGMITFVPSSILPNFKYDDVLETLFYIVLNGCAEYDPERIVKNRKSNHKDYKMLEKNVINFAGQKATNIIIGSDHKKYNDIEFCRENTLVMFHFEAPKESYANMISDIEKSLNTFEIIKLGDQFSFPIITTEKRQREIHEAAFEAKETWKKKMFEEQQ